MKKPPFISHYLVLNDLLNGVNVRQYNDTVVYLTSRIENIKCDLVKSGIEFVEDITKESRFTHYKPYVLLQTAENISKARKLLEHYKTDEVVKFLEEKPSIEAVSCNEAQRGD